MLISELGRKDRPVGTIQFGGGVFLRGFYDVMVAKNNKVGISDENIFIVRSKTRSPRRTICTRTSRATRSIRT